MKIRNIKQEKAITLIALVITIIVLLILAGVAISMLSGENGILTRASEAKENTEIAQKEEEQKLEDMELQMYLLSNSNYKYAYGYITGFTDSLITIAEFEKELNQYGLKITKKYEYDELLETGEYIEIEESEKNDTYIATGMVVEKDGKEIAKTVIFGDNDFNGDCDSDDIMYLYSYVLNQDDGAKRITLDFVKVAMDVNHDGIVDGKDFYLMYYYTLGYVEDKKFQENYATNPAKIEYDIDSMNAFSQEMGKGSDTYEITYNNAKDEFCFVKKTNDDTTVEIF